MTFGGEGGNITDTYLPIKFQLNTPNSISRRPQLWVALYHDHSHTQLIRECSSLIAAASFILLKF